MATISQLVRKPRKRRVAKNMVPALQKSPQKRGVCTRGLYDYAEEAEFGAAQGLSGAAHQWVRGELVHRR